MKKHERLNNNLLDIIHVMEIQIHHKSVSDIQGIQLHPERDRDAEEATDRINVELTKCTGDMCLAPN